MRMRSSSRSGLVAVSLALTLQVLPAETLRAAGADTSIPAGEKFGAGVTLERVSDLREVVAHPERYAERPVLLTGRISDVCQKKGCWTILSRGDASIRVRFKDYGFFLPTDCSGKQAYVEGVVKLETLSEKRARHYASESRGGDPSAIHGPQRELGFVATGVRLIEAD